MCPWKQSNKKNEQFIIRFECYIDHCVSMLICVWLAAPLRSLNIHLPMCVSVSHSNRRTRRNEIMNAYAPPHVIRVDHVLLFPISIASIHFSFRAFFSRHPARHSDGCRWWFACWCFHRFPCKYRNPTKHDIEQRPKHTAHEIRWVSPAAVFLPFRIVRDAWDVMGRPAASTQCNRSKICLWNMRCRCQSIIQNL